MTTGMTITSAIQQFLSELPRSAKTKSTYAEGLRAFLKIVGEDAPLSLETYKKFLLATAGVPVSTQRTYAAPVRSMLIRIGRLAPADISMYTKDYGQRSGARFPRYDEGALDKLINYANSLSGDIIALRDRALIITLVDTGLRIHEACNLRRGDIDWMNARTVLIGKGDKQAVVRFSERSMQAMKDYLAARAALDGNSGKPLASLPLFARHDKSAGKKVYPLSTKGAWAAFKACLEDAGIDKGDVRVHDTRHYFCTTTLRASDNNLRVTQELARHGSIQMTARYTHLSNADLDASYDDIFNQKGR